LRLQAGFNRYASPHLFCQSFEQGMLRHRHGNTQLSDTRRFSFFSCSSRPLRCIRGFRSGFIGYPGADLLEAKLLSSAIDVGGRVDVCFS
jgi:hypothetical protein